MSNIIFKYDGYEIEPLNVIEINGILFVRKDKLDKCYDTLNKVLSSQILVNSPFSNYSEAIYDAKELIAQLKEVRG